MPLLGAVLRGQRRWATQRRKCPPLLLTAGRAHPPALRPQSICVTSGAYPACQGCPALRILGGPLCASPGAPFGVWVLQSLDLAVGALGGPEMRGETAQIRWRDAPGPPEGRATRSCVPLIAPLLRNAPKVAMEPAKQKPDFDAEDEFEEFEAQGEQGPPWGAAIVRAVQGLPLLRHPLRAAAAACAQAA